MATIPGAFDLWADGAPAVAPKTELGDLSLWANGAPAGPHVQAAAASYWAFVQRPPMAAQGPLGVQRTG